MKSLEKFVKYLTDSSIVYDAVQFILEGDYHQYILKALNLSKESKILDIGSGTGYFSQFFECDYTGIDSDEDYIRNAKKKYEEKNRIFLVQDCKRINFPDKHFDKSIFVNVIHHLSDEDLLDALKETKRVTKNEIFIFDVTTEKNSFLTPIILGLDNGKHIRSLDEQKRVIGSFLDIAHTEIFNTPRNILKHTIVKCII